MSVDFVIAKSSMLRANFPDDHGQFQLPGYGHFIKLIMSTNDRMWTMSTKSHVTPDIEVGRLVDRFVRHIQADLGRKSPAFDEEKVGPAGGMVLMALADHEPVAIHELVRVIARDKAQVTRLLQSLSTKGLVEKRQSPSDGRVCVLQLTTKGQKTVTRLRYALAETINGLLGRLNETERDALKALLKKAFDA